MKPVASGARLSNQPAANACSNERDLKLAQEFTYQAAGVAIGAVDDDRFFRFHNQPFVVRGAGFDAFVRFAPIRTPYFSVTAREIDDRYHYEIRESVDLGNCREMLVEIPLLIAHGYARTLGATGLHLARLDPAYPRLKNAAYHQRWFACPVQFEAEVHALQNPAYDRSTWRSSLRTRELAAAEMGKRDLIAGTRALIAAAVEEAPVELDLEHAARRLNVSSRTLIRHLQQAGTSFQNLREETLKRKTLELLQQPGLSIQEIGAMLGYSDAANFGRAFKRWFGMSPGSFRKTIGS